VARRRLNRLLVERPDQPYRVLGAFSAIGKANVFLRCTIIAGLAWLEVSGRIVLGLSVVLGTVALFLLPGALVALVMTRGGAPDLAGRDVWWIATRGRVPAVDQPVTAIRPLPVPVTEGGPGPAGGPGRPDALIEILTPGRHAGAPGQVSAYDTSAWNGTLSGGDPTSGRSSQSVAEDRGFEPLRAFTQRAFQARALGHYANPPSRRLPEGEPHATPGRRRRFLSRLSPRLQWAQAPRVVVPHRTPPGPEGSKGRRALLGTRGVLRCAEPVRLLRPESGACCPETTVLAVWRQGFGRFCGNKRWVAFVSGEPTRLGA
jgi:hypothetical protein